MITFEEFEDLIDEILVTFPKDLFKELNGGVFAREFEKFHPEARNNDLYIMGEYHRDRHLGRFIVLYYGSFAHVYRYMDRDSLEKEVRRVLKHEFLHHVESLAGEKDLEIEDAKRIAQYKASVARREE